MRMILVYVNVLKNMYTIERKLLQCINRINKWATNNDFKISKDRTQ